MNLSIEKNIEKATAFFGFLSILYTFSSGDLRSTEGISGEQYLLLYVIPGFVVAFTFIVSLLFADKQWKNIVFSFPKGAIYGVGAGYALLSLIVLYSWYENPDNGKLEPLFVTFGIAIGAAEVARRMIESLIEPEAESA